MRMFAMLPGGRPFDLSPGKFYGWQRDAQSFKGMATFPSCGFREFADTGTGAARRARKQFLLGRLVGGYSLFSRVDKLGLVKITTNTLRDALCANLESITWN